MVSTRQQREKLVLYLYHNQGKNTREIAEEARMSFSAIGAILKKAEEEKEPQGEQEQKLSLASQAYKLYSERKKTLAQVAIVLNLREPEVTKFYMEYCKLTQLDSLCRIYDKIKDDIYPFVKLYMLSKAARMSTQDVVNLLTVANNELPSVEYRCEKLKREASLKAGNQNSARTLQELSYLISTTRNTLDQYELSCKQRRLEMDNTNKEYTMIKAFVKDFRDNNEEYVKIKQTVKREVESILTARRHLLKLAVLSIVGSLRKDSLKFYALYYNMSSSSAKSSSLPKTTSDVSQQHYNYIPFMNEQNLPIIDYSNEEIYEKILLDESEELYDKIVEDLTNKTISDVASDSKSSLSLSLAHNELSGLQKSRMMRDM